MPARSIRPIMEGVDSTPSPPMCFTTRLSSTTVVISALSPGCNFSMSTSCPPFCSTPAKLAGQLLCAAPPPDWRGGFDPRRNPAPPLPPPQGVPQQQRAPTAPRFIVDHPPTDCGKGAG